MRGSIVHSQNFVCTGIVGVHSVKTLIIMIRLFCLRLRSVRIIMMHKNYQKSMQGITKIALPKLSSRVSTKDTVLELIN